MKVLVRVHTTRRLPVRRRAEVVKLCAHAVRLDAHCIGWVPWQFYDWHDQHGRLLSVHRDGELVGFCAWREDGFTMTARVMQIWVRGDARMIEHGRALVERLEVLGGAMGLGWVTLWCADDLEANRFWLMMGFREAGRRLGRGDPFGEGNRRIRRHHVLYVRCIQPTTARVQFGDVIRVVQSIQEVTHV